MDNLNKNLCKNSVIQIRQIAFITVKAKYPDLEVYLGLAYVSRYYHVDIPVGLLIHFASENSTASV